MNETTEEKDFRRLECAARVLSTAVQCMDDDPKIANSLLHAARDLIGSCDVNRIKTPKEEA